MANVSRPNGARSASYGDSRFNATMSVPLPWELPTERQMAAVSAVSARHPSTPLATDYGHAAPHYGRAAPNYQAAASVYPSSAVAYPPSEAPPGYRPPVWAGADAERASLEPEVPRTSRVRTFLTRTLFVLLFGAVGALLVYEVLMFRDAGWKWPGNKPIIDPPKRVPTVVEGPAVPKPEAQRRYQRMLNESLA